MSLYESASSSFHVVTPRPQTQTLHPELLPGITVQPSTITIDPSASTTLSAKQSSILSLTLDEIQMKSGKNFGSMNMDEFLANLWTVDENESLPKDKSFERKSVDTGLSNLTRQGSLSVPVPLCKKTVDEVWFEIQKGIHQNGDNMRPPPADHNAGEEFHRQQTLGEITLEDFLIKAGVVQEKLNTTMTTNFAVDVSNPEFSLGLSCQKSNTMVGGYDVNRSAYSIFPGDSNFAGESSSNVFEDKGKSIRFLTALDGFGVKKRIIDGPPEVLLERRQRRMIKNRESAARSRARKQAYTVELELELNHLTEENLKLKKIVEENDKKRKQEVMSRSSQIIRERKGEKLRRIRRILSTGW